jgi:hypothetical protein
MYLTLCGGFDLITTMALPTPPNLLVNVKTFEVKEGVAWTFDEDLNKFKCPIESCKGGPYKYQNHLRTHAIQA